MVKRYIDRRNVGCQIFNTVFEPRISRMVINKFYMILHEFVLKRLYYPDKLMNNSF